jgi:type II secretory pathway component GspD/PulD (secretin)
MVFAPQFDASFLRLLDQKGKTKAYTSGSITVVNDFDGSYHITLVPGYQNISKTDTMEVSIQQEADSSFTLTVNNPVICFQGGTILEPTHDDPQGYAAANLMFGYEIDWQTVVERNNTGTEFVNVERVESSLTLACGAEKLLAEFTREQDVNQYNGIPFLGDIPGLKYAVGADTHSKSYAKYFVTVEATPIRPEASLSAWAGEVVEAVDMISQTVEKN